MKKIQKNKILSVILATACMGVTAFLYINASDPAALIYNDRLRSFEQQKDYLNQSMPIVMVGNGDDALKFGQKLKDIFMRLTGVGSVRSTVAAGALITQCLDNSADAVFSVSEDIVKPGLQMQNTAPIFRTPSPELPDSVSQPTPPADNSQTGIKIENAALAIRTDRITMRDETTKQYDIEELLKEPLKLKMTGDGPKILILHTHASEAYTPEGSDVYLPEMARSDDSGRNIIRVGEEMTEVFSQEGINVLHDKTMHDYPSFNGSYKSSLATIEKYMKKYPTIQIVLDVHRDSMTASDGTTLKVSSSINGEQTAQVMLVVGTDQGGLVHPEWRENFKLALKLAQKMNQVYPGLSRPVNLRKERFNQHATNGSMILEMGSSGNTLEEALRAAKYVALSLIDVLKPIS